MATAFTVAATAAGGAMQAYGQAQQGRMQQANAEYNAKVMENQAVADQQQTRERMIRQRLANRELLGKNRADTAASGVVVDTGSPLKVMAENVKRMEMQISDMAWESSTRQSSLRQQAGLQRAQGQAARSAGNLSAIGTLLNTGARAGQVML